MRILFFILVFFLFPYGSNLFAQPYRHLLKNDRHWIYTQMAFEEFPVHITHAFSLSMQGDTMLQGNFYKKLYQHTLRLNEFSTAIAYPKQILNTSLYALIREDTLARKVYFLPLQDTIFFCQSTEHLLYDFSLQVGDTLNACVVKNLYEPSLTYIPRIDSIRQEIYFGQEGRAFYTKGFFVNEGLLAEGTGKLLEGFGYEAHGLIDFGRMGPLVRFVFFCEGSFMDCGFVSATQEHPELPQSAVTISPNPTGDIVTIQITPAFQNETELDVSFFNTTGRIVCQVSGSATEMLEVDVSSLPDGIYFLKTNGERMNIIRKILITH